MSLFLLFFNSRDLTSENEIIRNPFSLFSFSLPVSLEMCSTLFISLEYATYASPFPSIFPLFLPLLTGLPTSSTKIVMSRDSWPLLGLNDLRYLKGPAGVSETATPSLAAP